MLTSILFARVRALCSVGLAVVAAGAAAAADIKTVCTITVNSPDEKEVLQRTLPAERYRFVELVERGRPDWLASACRQGIQCDVLVISGHYDGGTEFFSDRLEAREYLPVDELERVSCSDSCPGLFSQLKEVYLFGCNTLNAEPTKVPSDEVVRSFMRSGFSRADAQRMSRALGVRHGESSRDRMRQIFKDVPVLYGFSSVAPVGPVAAPLLGRHLQAVGTAEFGAGRVSTRLLGAFAGHAMTATPGLGDGDAQAPHRRDLCQFADDRLPAARKLGFVHTLLQRDMGEVRLFLDRLERYAATMDPALPADVAVAEALDRIAGDEPARARYLEFARDADLLPVRARMFTLAQRLGWLSPEEQRSELIRMFDAKLAGQAISPADVDLACSLNNDGALDSRADPPPIALGQAATTGHAALLACLGSEEAQARVVDALTSPNDDDVRIAQVYLRHRPIDDPRRLRDTIAAISRMGGSDAQVRALLVLAEHRLSDPEGLIELARLFPLAESARVQTAIAGVLLRSDYQSIASPELLRTLQQHRLQSASAGQDAIDVLIRRMQLQ